MDWEIVDTKDGSKTVYSKLFNATYHSKHGALAESKHIFIENGLKYVHDKGKSEINVLEIGFGTGLNAMLTLQYASKQNIKVNYTGIEKHEVPKELIDQLGYKYLFAVNEYDLFDELLQAKNAEVCKLGANFNLLKKITDIKEVLWEQTFDVIYFDAFSPRHVPHMWTPELFEQMFNVLEPGGVLVTFCAQGKFKRDLRSVGFKVEKLPGAPGKREMTRGVREK